MYRIEFKKSVKKDLKNIDKSSIKVIGTAIKKGSAIPGPRGEKEIHKLGIDWQSVVDQNR